MNELGVDQHEPVQQNCIDAPRIVLSLIPGTGPIGVERAKGHIRPDGDASGGFVALSLRG